ncbi:hypothetical protein EZJ49_03965 [Bdellovibrio bacteriovorus]|uniref:hypothetical protein n=1 Tax=Bdellovibrio bacteriovorus TaxID=959 RepID=UPI0021D29CC2|nr:hypothetical protein [Bdellovibrio bacteriovorus]UXR65407.1 hypothetical protein EZJ49_03965 [Bdellovibrio bacteriovorus]
MKAFALLFGLSLGLALAPDATLAAITKGSDYVIPAEESVSTMRSSALPCYSRSQKSVGSRARLSYIEGERCALPKPTEARRLDRLDHEPDDPGMPFKKRDL